MLWDAATSTWIRTTIQGYDVTAWWSYTDWYAEGYNSFTKADYELAITNDIFNVNDQLGDIIKIQNVGSGGWLLLEKTGSEDSEDYTVNYKTVGRQNGTIQFSNAFYNIARNSIGFDNRNYKK